MKRHVLLAVTVGVGRLALALFGMSSGGSGFLDSWFSAADAPNGPGMGSTLLGSSGGAPPGTGDNPGDGDPGDGDPGDPSDDELRPEDAPSDDFLTNLLNNILLGTQSTPVGMGVTLIENTRNVNRLKKALEFNEKRGEAALDLARGNTD